MALRKITIEVSEDKAGTFESFLKGLATPQTPVAGDRLFSLAMGQAKQRKHNVERNKEMREAVKIVKERGLLPAKGAKA